MIENRIINDSQLTLSRIHQNAVISFLIAFSALYYLCCHIINRFMRFILIAP